MIEKTKVIFYYSQEHMFKILVNDGAIFFFLFFLPLENE